MTPPEFSIFLNRVVPDFAAAMVSSGECDAAHALHVAQREVSMRLPAQALSLGHDVLTICKASDGMRVGDLWLEYRSEGGQLVCAILYIFIEGFARAHGFAQDALAAAESRALEAGAGAIRLTVVGDNHPALSLYRKLGYRVLSARLGKSLRQEPGAADADQGMS